MVKIRLRRVGAKKQPHYRVVVTEASSPRDGKVLETIGHFNPRTEPPAMEIDAERALYWLGVGAQPTEAVKRMLDKLGIMARVTAVKRGEVLPEAKAKPVPAGPERPEEELAEEAGLLEPDEGETEEEAFVEAEEEEAEEEEDEFGEEPFEDDEVDAEELWEPDVAVTDEESEDFEEDWELDVDDEDDDDIDDDDEPYENDDE